MSAEIRESFVFYRSFKESITELSDSEKLIMYEAISDYALDRVEPSLTGFPKMLFKLIRPQLDANFRKWENGCKGKEYGDKGGAPKGNQNARKKKDNNPKTTPNQPQNNPETTRNVNDNANVNDNDNVIKKEKTKKKSSQSMTEEELAFHNGMAERYPTIMMLREPLRLDQYRKLVSEFGKEVVIDKLECMENYKPLLEKNNSANRTIRNWIKREQK